MTDSSRPEYLIAPLAQKSRQRQQSRILDSDRDGLPVEIHVGRCLRDLRMKHGLSIRCLAVQSGLNVNTLSLIENGRTSPSVSTLQLLASALDVPITAFFDHDTSKDNIAYQKAGERVQAAFAHGTISDLGAGLTFRGGQPLLVTIEPYANSGPTPIVHTGHEFVFCLEGCIAYTIKAQNYILKPGDSLVFQAHLPHCWQNASERASKSLLIMCPADEGDDPTTRHFQV